MHLCDKLMLLHVVDVCDVDRNEVDLWELRYGIIESRHVELRRKYAGSDVSRLTEGESPEDYAMNRDGIGSTSNVKQGFIVFYDELRHRNIYVSSLQVGVSRAFHEEHGIKTLFHLIKKNSNHESYDDMTLTTRKWWLDNMQYVAVQMLDAEGNIVLICNSGRTRSPMYLVAYLIIMYSMTVRKSMKVVADLLNEQRSLVLDRYRSLVPIVENILNLI